MALLVLVEVGETMVGAPDATAGLVAFVDEVAADSVDPGAFGRMSLRTAE
jgi:hypothetical protein